MQQFAGRYERKHGNQSRGYHLAGGYPRPQAGDPGFSIVDASVEFVVSRGNSPGILFFFFPKDKGRRQMLETDNYKVTKGGSFVLYVRT